MWILVPSLPAGLSSVHGTGPPHFPTTQSSLIWNWLTFTEGWGKDYTFHLPGCVLFPAFISRSSDLVHLDVFTVLYELWGKKKDASTIWVFIGTSFFFIHISYAIYNLLLRIVMWRVEAYNILNKAAPCSPLHFGMQKRYVSIAIQGRSAHLCFPAYFPNAWHADTHQYVVSHSQSVRHLYILVSTW